MPRRTSRSGAAGKQYAEEHRCAFEPSQTYCTTYSNFLTLIPRATYTPAVRSDDEALPEGDEAREAVEAMAAKPRHKARYVGLKSLMQALLSASLQRLSLQAPQRKRQKLQDFPQPAPAPGCLKGA